jgi:hypothetical protein
MADDGLRWIVVGRGRTKEEVRDQLLAWCEEQGLTEPPPMDETRWHHGLADIGEYWDVWVRVSVDEVPDSASDS